MRFFTPIFILYLLIGIQSSTLAQKYLTKLGKTKVIESKILGEKRTLWVQVPAGSAERKYPVLYVLDGGVHLPAIVAMLNLDEGLLPKMIVVGIANNTHRNRDLTPHKSPLLPKSGGGKKFTNFITQELIPYIDQNYPTQPHRTLVGHSLGGLFVINALLNHPKYFHNYIAIDPSFWFNEPVYKQALTAIKSKGRFSKKALFLAVANTMMGVKHGLDTNSVMQDTTEMTRHIRYILSFGRVAAHQKHNGLSYAWKYYPHESHSSITLVAIYQALRKVFGWYQMNLKDLSRINNPKTDAKTALKLFNNYYDQVSRKFGYQVFPDEEYLNALGYMYIDTKQPKRAKAFLEMGVKYYPKSANAYDSMSDYYLSQKDLPKALKYVQQAYELKKNKYYKKKIAKIKAQMK